LNVSCASCSSKSSVMVCGHDGSCRGMSFAYGPESTGRRPLRRLLSPNYVHNCKTVAPEFGNSKTAATAQELSISNVMRRRTDIDGWLHPHPCEFLDFSNRATAARTPKGQTQCFGLFGPFGRRLRSWLAVFGATDSAAAEILHSARATTTRYNYPPKQLFNQISTYGEPRETKWMAPSDASCHVAATLLPRGDRALPQPDRACQSTAVTTSFDTSWRS
jgi:hypothetical protein